MSGQSITIEEAERMRQARIANGLREKTPEIYETALAAMVAQKLAFTEMARVKILLAGAVTPSQVADILDVLDGESNELLRKKPEERTLAQTQQAEAPKLPAFVEPVPAVEATPKARKAQQNATV